ncbi:putative RNA polymerase alpha subunit C-terminal domain protein [Erythrobacter phage vB_EliS-L02]|nr:putative RNA polymerase alpha subunit C-terminal domain protein [Erythrobacter phage vB_EliS-L02]
MVKPDDIYATLDPAAACIRTGFQIDCGGRKEMHPWREDRGNCLVGSAEQGFLSMNLPPDAYVGVTPCFRWERHNDLLTRDYFMKVELFVTSEEADLGHVMSDACEVMRIIGDDRDGACPTIDVVETEEGFDAMLGGVEVGSYGERATSSQAWIYGTGLALPRFSVAKALAKIT